MSPAQKKAYEELYPLHGLGDETVDWDKLFPDAKRRVVEIGFGMGDATRQVSAAHPDWGIIGIEVHVPGVGKLLWWIQKEGLQNIRVIRRDAEAVFQEQIPCGSIDALHIWFPDPWPKKRHHKRRLINPANASLFSQALKEGGVIHIVTDWEPYAEQILNILEAQRNMINRYAKWAPKPAYRPQTRFEEKGAASGRVIHDILFERKG